MTSTMQKAPATLQRDEGQKFNTFDTQHSTRPPLSDTITGVIQMQRRAVEDMLTQATADYWDRRAETFEWARPRPGDFNGHATAADLAARDARLATQAEQCRLHARLLRGEHVV